MLAHASAKEHEQEICEPLWLMSVGQGANACAETTRGLSTCYSHISVPAGTIPYSGSPRPLCAALALVKSANGHEELLGAHASHSHLARSLRSAAPNHQQ